MFGLGMSEVIVILIVALLFLGPDKLPGAAKAIGKGIRDLKKQTRELQDTLEKDTELGDAVRDLKSALRGDEAPPRRPALQPQPPAHAIVNERATPASSRAAQEQPAASATAAGGTDVTPPAADEAGPSPAARPPSDSSAHG